MNDLEAVIESVNSAISCLESLRDSLSDTDSKKNVETIPSISTLMGEYRGTTEYNGIVADIQKWYYGSVVQSAWCATALSYFADKCGILDAIGGKNENVNVMRQACKNSGKGVYYDREAVKTLDIKKDDILFWLWKTTNPRSIMTDTSSKHVGVAEYDSKKENPNVYCIGGNQKDKICTLEYDKAYLYAVFRPNKEG